MNEEKTRENVVLLKPSAFWRDFWTRYLKKRSKASANEQRKPVNSKHYNDYNNC